MDFAPVTLFFIAVAAIVVYFGYRAVRHDGFKTFFSFANFGAPIEQTIGEFIGKETLLTSMTLKVHLLRRGDRERLIGIALSATSFGSYAVMPMTLSVSQVKQLASLLQRATRTQSGIEHTIGVITGEKQWLRVHVLPRKHEETLIGIHLDGAFADGEGMPPVALSVDQTQQLASVLESATHTH